jgi:hypothetical protein
MNARRLPAGLAVLVLVAAGSSLLAQAGKPLGEADLVRLIELKIDDDVIVTRINKLGVSFAADAGAVERLKKAGAADVVVDAVRKADHSRAAAAPDRTVTYDDVLRLLELGVDSPQIIKSLEQSPTVFTLDTAQADALKKAGASDALLASMQGRGRTAGGRGDVTDIALILDCSGSMSDRTREGPSKMEAAKKVVTELVDKIPNGRRVTFLVYGHNAEEKCRAVKVLRPLGEIDDAGKTDLKQEIARLRPVGHTPIALALRMAAAELARGDGLCGLVLITDGMETCHGDPNAEAARLAANPRLVFGLHVIGFDVEPQERRAVEAIARAGKGKYYDARSATNLAAAVGDLARKIEQSAPVKDRPTQELKLAGGDLRPGSFFHDAPEVGAGKYRGALAFMQVDYFQVLLRKGQELRAIATVQKTPFRVSNPHNENDTETFGLTIYDPNLVAVAQDEVAIPATPPAPSSWKASWRALADGVAYVAVAASCPHDSKGMRSWVYPENARVNSSPYTLTLKVDGEAAEGPGERLALARAAGRPGRGFEEAMELPVPALTVTDIRFREVLFYKVKIKPREPVQYSLAAQKPLYGVSNEFFLKDHVASYTLTVYDEDQIPVARKTLEIAGRPPQAQSLVLSWTPQQGAWAYVSVSCENTGHDVYIHKGQEPPGPGRVAIQVVPTSNAATPPGEAKPDDK